MEFGNLVRGLLDHRGDVVAGVVLRPVTVFVGVVFPWPMRGAVLAPNTGGCPLIKFAQLLYQVGVSHFKNHPLLPQLEIGADRIPLLNQRNRADIVPALWASFPRRENRQGAVSTRAPP